jgi:LysM repeat protein
MCARADSGLIGTRIPANTCATGRPDHPKRLEGHLMKWKDSGESVEKEVESKEEYFDEEQYSPWADPKEMRKSARRGKPPLLLILLSVALFVSIVVLVVLLSGNSENGAHQQIAALEQRIQQAEQRLNKYDTIDEKVTRIWEQAQSFEKFKDRFDRSEASMSLRMDHMTAGLENLKKQVNQAPPVQARQTAANQAPAVPKKPQSVLQYHEVTAGETLFSISKRYNLSVEALLQINRMGPDDVIKPGQKLIVANQ